MQHRESPERPRLDSAQPAGSRFHRASRLLLGHPALLPPHSLVRQHTRQARLDHSTLCLPESPAFWEN